MAFEVAELVRTIHILFAAAWAGGGIMLAFIIGPTLRIAGPAAGPFVMAQMRRGGFSPFFAVVGILTILSGGAAYSMLGYAADPFGRGTVLLTVGAMIAILTFLHSLFTLMPGEKKIKALVRSIQPGAPPTPQQATEFAALAAKQGKHSAIGAGMVVVVLILMAAHRLV